MDIINWLLSKIEQVPHARIVLCSIPARVFIIIMHCRVYVLIAFCLVLYLVLVLYRRLPSKVVLDRRLSQYNITGSIFLTGIITSSLANKIWRG